jgi:hypothetical protein
VQRVYLDSACRNFALLLSLQKKKKFSTIFEVTILGFTCIPCYFQSSSKSARTTLGFGRKRPYLIDLWCQLRNITKLHGVLTLHMWLHGWYKLHGACSTPYNDNILTLPFFLPIIIRPSCSMDNLPNDQYQDSRLHMCVNQEVDSPDL